MNTIFDSSATCPKGNTAHIELTAQRGTPKTLNVSEFLSTVLYSSPLWPKGHKPDRVYQYTLVPSYVVYTLNSRLELRTMLRTSISIPVLIEVPVACSLTRGPPRLGEAYPFLPFFDSKSISFASRYSPLVVGGYLAGSSSEQNWGRHTTWRLNCVGQRRMPVWRSMRVQCILEIDVIK